MKLTTDTNNSVRVSSTIANRTHAAESLAGKVVLVTGSASGIGRALAERALEDGAKLVVSDLDTCAFESGRDTLETSGVLRISADVTAKDQVARLFEQVTEQFGRLDALAHCAGIEAVAPSDEFDEEHWEEVINTNLKGTFLCNQFAIRSMLAQGRGVVLNVASQLGVVGYPMMAAYCASKGGVVLLTKSLALEYAARNIRVNCVCPGPTATPMLDRMLVSTTGKTRETIFGMRKVPIGRMARPEEIAEVGRFLLSDASSYVTGCAVSADGGWTAA